jgi:hypothetical protein
MPTTPIKIRTPITIPAMVPPEMPQDFELLPDVPPPFVEPLPGVDVEDAATPERAGIPVAEADISTILESVTP